MGQSGADNEVVEDNEDEIEKSSVGEEVDTGNNSSKDSDESEGSSESEINDTASEGFLEEIEEKLDEKLENPEVLVAPAQQEGEDDVDSEESTDNKEDVSDN